MRPSFSIIFFTVLSGVGYGLWFLLGLGLAVHWRTCSPLQPVAGSGITLALCGYPGVIDYGLAAGFILVSAGLISSLAHLGQPQRAWRALTQWRSSWLSREGVASIVAYAPATALIFIAGVTVLNPSTNILRWLGWMRPLGGVLAIAAAVTVFCTAHIYSSLKPIRAWHNRYVVPAYLMFGLYGGGLCLWALATLPGAWRTRETPALLTGIIVVAASCALLKYAYWRHIDRDQAPSAGHATGLGTLGSVSSFEQPHTEENYLTHEMGFVLARKHSRKLRAIVLVAGFLIPALFAALGLALPATRVAAAWLALAAGMLGIFVERWLFFAEAKHAVMAYYGR